MDAQEKATKKWNQKIESIETISLSARQLVTL